jgi:hypothetical protein
MHLALQCHGNRGTISWYLTYLRDPPQHLYYVTHQIALFRPSDHYLGVTRSIKSPFGMRFVGLLALNCSARHLKLGI